MPITCAGLKPLLDQCERNFAPATDSNRHAVASAPGKLAMKISLFVVVTALAINAVAVRAATPAKPGDHVVTATDTKAIEAVLASYTQAVNSGNEKKFRALLLSDDIPFSASSAVTSLKTGMQRDTHRYADFRKAVFESGAHYKQTFDHVRIEQDGDLASVALDFVTRNADGPGGGFGFKVLHLLNINGDWKIASEFYTAYPLSN